MRTWLFCFVIFLTYISLSADFVLNVRLKHITYSPTKNRGILNFEYAFEDTVTRRHVLINRKISPSVNIEGSDTILQYFIGFPLGHLNYILPQEGKDYAIRLRPVDEQQLQRYPRSYYNTNCKLSVDTIIDEFCSNTPLLLSTPLPDLVDVDNVIYSISIEQVPPPENYRINHMIALRLQYVDDMIALQIPSGMLYVPTNTQK